jgi:hypothetical protein
MYTFNTSSGNRYRSKLHPHSALRQWFEDLLSVTLIILAAGALILGADMYLDRNRDQHSPAQSLHSVDGVTVPAVYPHHERGHSIDI